MPLNIQTCGGDRVRLPDLRDYSSCFVDLPPSDLQLGDEIDPFPLLVIFPYHDRVTSQWKIKDRSLPIGERTLVMGILNVTPDSFSDGGEFLSPDQAVQH